MREMKAFNSGDRKRVLPCWMTAQAPQESRVPVKTPKRKRMEEVPLAAARLPAVRTVYCMSEAELVDVALGVLIESRKQEEALERPPLASPDKPELSPTCPESPSSPGRSEDEDNGNGAPPPGLSPSQGPDSAYRSPEEDEDVFKYVREIFFS
ncbi:cell cycle regulator of non-homologous end joining [Saccopteryx bilineata]|uniref:cell cycle regulator of non-homologous end joining n=1 Tax=Saccopteryx bilineata TaxID=59482 RepID=UPI00338DFFD2